MARPVLGSRDSDRLRTPPETVKLLRCPESKERSVSSRLRGPWSPPSAAGPRLRAGGRPARALSPASLPRGLPLQTDALPSEARRAPPEARSLRLTALRTQRTACSFRARLGRRGPGGRVGTSVSDTQALAQKRKATYAHSSPPPFCPPRWRHWVQTSPALLHLLLQSPCSPHCLCSPS